MNQHKDCKGWGQPGLTRGKENGIDIATRESDDDLERFADERSDA